MLPGFNPRSAQPGKLKLWNFYSNAFNVDFFVADKYSYNLIAEYGDGESAEFYGLRKDFLHAATTPIDSPGGEKQTYRIFGSLCKFI